MLHITTDFHAKVWHNRLTNFFGRIISPKIVKDSTRIYPTCAHILYHWFQEPDWSIDPSKDVGYCSYI